MAIYAKPAHILYKFAFFVMVTNFFYKSTAGSNGKIKWKVYMSTNTIISEGAPDFADSFGVGTSSTHSFHHSMVCMYERYQEIILVLAPVLLIHFITQLYVCMNGIKRLFWCWNQFYSFLSSLNGMC